MAGLRGFEPPTFGSGGGYALNPAVERRRGQIRGAGRSDSFCGNTALLSEKAFELSDAVRAGLGVRVKEAGSLTGSG